MNPATLGPMTRDRLNTAEFKAIALARQSGQSTIWLMHTYEGVYWISNADGSKAGLFILASSGDYISFMGKAEVEGNIITITDAVSGNAVAIAVTNKGDGTIGLSGGIATTDGTTTNFEATVAPVSVDQAFKVIQDINKYGNMIA